VQAASSVILGETNDATYICRVCSASRRNESRIVLGETQNKCLVQTVSINGKNSSDFVGSTAAGLRPDSIDRQVYPPAAEHLSRYL